MTKMYPLILLSALTFAGAAQQPPESGAAPPAPERRSSMPAMQGNMQHMRDLMARIHETSDPTERRRLMDEHMRTMHDAMHMMNGMGSQPRAACTEGDSRCEMQRMQGEQQMMQRRMDMMQGMMGQMMDHMMQRSSQAAPAEEPNAAPSAEGAPQNHEVHH